MKIGRWVLKSDESLLVDDDTQIQLEPKLVDVLVYLAKNQGKVISREELISEVWKGAIVTDNAVNRVIAKLRKSLSHADSEEQYIVTVPKKGYLLKATVEETYEFVSDEVFNRREEDSAKTKSKPPSWLINIGALAIIVSTVVYLFYEQDKPIVARYNLVNPFTSMAGNEDSASFSSDGEAVVFTHQPVGDGVPNTYIQLVNEPTRIRLTQSDAIESMPAWSPDGSKVLIHRRSADVCQYVAIHLDRFTKEPRSEEAVMNCDSSIVIGGGVWARDNKTFYYPKATSLTQPLRIYSYNTETGRQKQISQPPKGVTGDYFARLSPTGDELLILRNLYWFDTEVLVVDLETGESQVLFSKPWPLKDIAWGETNQKLLFADMQGRIIQFDRQTQSEKAIWINSETVTSPAISPVTQSLVFTSGNTRNSDIWQLKIDDALENVPLINSTVSDVHPAFANRSEDIAYFSFKSGLPQIWVRNERGQDRQVSNFTTMMETSNLLWSPDDKSLLSTSRNRVYSINVDTGKIQYHTPQSLNAKNPIWSRTGNEIYFSSDVKDGWQIWQVDAYEPDKLTQITKNGGFSVRLGNTESHLFYSKDDRNGLFLIDLNTKEDRLVYKDFFAVNAYYNWQIVGNNLYFANDGEQSGVYKYDLEEQDLELLAAAERIKMRGLAVSRDEKRILWVHKAETETNLKIVTKQSIK